MTAGAWMQGAAIKLYKGLACPLDGFELVLCSLSGPDGMTYPLCPFCYNNPPFEGIQKVCVTLCKHMKIVDEVALVVHYCVAVTCLQAKPSGAQCCVSELLLAVNQPSLVLVT